MIGRHAHVQKILANMEYSFCTGDLVLNIVLGGVNLSTMYNMCYIMSKLEKNRNQENAKNLFFENCHG